MGTRISTIAKIICTHLKKILEIKKKKSRKNRGKNQKHFEKKIIKKSRKGKKWREKLNGKNYKEKNREKFKH